MQSALPISIIIPMRNAASSVSDCLESVCTQSLQDIEIVCVDDASQDTTRSIVNEWSTRDSRIHLISLPRRRGAAHARNVGLDHANGAFVHFVDADDRLCKDALQALYQTAHACGSDAVKGLMLVEEPGQAPTPHHLNQRTAYRNTDLRRCGEIQHLYQYQSYLFRLQVIRAHGLQFDDTLENFQDPEFLSRLLPRCARIDVILVPVYLRRRNPASIIGAPWRVTNYLSLIRGISQSWQSLLDQNQPEAAKKMAECLPHWWYKFESLADRDRPGDWQAVAQALFMLQKRLSVPICPFRWKFLHVYLVLQFIREQRFDSALLCMRISKQRGKGPIHAALLKVALVPAYSGLRVLHGINRKHD